MSWKKSACNSRESCATSNPPASVCTFSPPVGGLYSASHFNESYGSENMIFLLSLSLLSEPNRSPPSPLETYHLDPMLSESFAATDDDLLRFLNSPNVFVGSCSDILQDEAGLLDCGFTGYNGLPQQSCGSIFQ